MITPANDELASSGLGYYWSICKVPGSHLCFQTWWIHIPLLEPHLPLLCRAVHSYIAVKMESSGVSVNQKYFWLVGERTLLSTFTQQLNGLKFHTVSLEVFTKVGFYFSVRATICSLSLSCIHGEDVEVMLLVLFNDGDGEVQGL